MIRSPYPDEHVPDATVFDFLFGGLSDGDVPRVAIVDGPGGSSTTYGELRDAIEAFAGALAVRGVGVGDAVGMVAPNVPAFAVAFHGILRAGATATPASPLATSEELARQWADAGTRALVTVAELLPRVLVSARHVGIPDALIVVLDGADGHPSLRDLLAERAPVPHPTIDPATHVAVLPYSSGTTGTPKGVRLTHRNLVANVVQCRPAVDVESHDVLLAVLPFFHIYGLTVLLDLALHRRARLVTMSRFDLAEFLEIVARERCTYLFIAPPIALALAKHPLVDAADLSHVRAVLSGAAALDDELARAVGSRLGARVRQGYGMTELSPVSHVIPFDRDDIPLGTIGVPVANVECRLVDPASGADILPPQDGWSDAGELLVRGPNVMLGYLGRPDATAETIDDDGFLHTGDLARVDSRGVFAIVDRLKELIKYHGYQVAPAELEAVLLTHPAIVDAAVVGVRRDDGEEVPKAFVVRAAGAELDDEAVMTYVSSRVAPYKKVRVVEFISSVPKSAAGKILRKELRSPQE